MDFRHLCSSRLILSPHARVWSAQGQFLVTTPEADYRFGGRGAEIMGEVQHELYGAETVGDIATHHGLDENELCAILAMLLDGEAVLDLSPMLASRSVAEYLSHYYAMCDSWAQDIFAAQFWQSMTSGAAPLALIAGWGLEFYHRVVGAATHNVISLQYCQNSAVRVSLADHFAQERGHGKIFLDGLARVGLNPTVVVARTPLPATQALLNYLDVLAGVDTLAYLGCFGVMHSPHIGRTRELIEAQFDGWIAQYPAVAPLIACIRRHALIDLEQDQIVFESLCRHREVLSNYEMLRIAQAARGIVIAFNSFFEGILVGYGGTDSELPWMEGRSTMAAAEAVSHRHRPETDR